MVTREMRGKTVLKRRSITWALFVLVALATSIGLAFAWESGDRTERALHPDLAFADTPSSSVVAAHSPSIQEAVYEGGRTACRRCHLAQFRSWQRTPHAGAFETLPEENRGDPNCVRCHVTGLGQPGGFTSIEETPNLANVTCEACHGPGSLYRDEDIMQDRDAAIAAGLRIPDEQTCLSCHNDESPTFPGSFDYEAMKAAGVHDIGS